MKKLLSLLILVSFFVTVPVAVADEGMWTFDNPPLKQWKEVYGFEPSKEWLDKVRLASVKVGGASGSFVSPNGLIITNQHVASSALSRLSTPQRNLVREGFYAKNQEDELKIPNYEVTILVSYEDVTTRVQSSVRQNSSDTEAENQRKAEIAAIEKESTDKSGFRSEVFRLYNGGEYWLYRFKRYTDVRLVFAPEEQIAFFGGDYDNFTFPRHDLDITFMRAYENDKPAATPNYFKWSLSGATDKEFVIVPGYPGSTARLLTVAQLEYQRDHGNPLQKKIWNIRRMMLEDYAARGEEQARQANDGIRSFRNSLKRLDGQQEGLLNPRQFSKKIAEEKDLVAAVSANAEMKLKYSSAWQQIASAYRSLPSYAERIQFTNLAPSRLGTIASQIVRFAEETAKPSDQRYEELRDARINAYRNSVLASTPIFNELEEYSLTRWLEEAKKNLGEKDPFIVAALGGKSPKEVVADAVKNTKLADVAFRTSLLEGGLRVVSENTDPMIVLAKKIEPVYRELRKWNEDNILSIDASAGERIAKARFAVYGKTLPPDANSQLRITFGRVASYEEDTTLVPYKTTFYGLYDRALSFNEQFPWHLPPVWKERKKFLNLSVPLNFVYSADTIGGNSGSPVINRNAEFVGINFDSNIQKLSNRYWYIEENEGSRAIGVHSAGILESLIFIYQTERLVREIVTARTD